MNEIKNFKWTGQVKTMNVLIIGQVSAGKSSFFNTLESSFKNYVSSTASSGSAEGSLTRGVIRDIKK
jgi:predicted GTPase